jgi:hypothetical protein
VTERGNDGMTASVGHRRKSSHGRNTRSLGTDTLNARSMERHRRLRPFARPGRSSIVSKPIEVASLIDEAARATSTT